MFELHRLVRPNIQNLKAYSSARSEFAGSAEVYLDANENAFGSPAGFGLNRYPDPLHTELKGRIALMNGVSPAQIFVGNGSDEAIDLLFRIFCKPGRDEVIICPPTYGMYRVSADINDVSVRAVNLTKDFQLDVRAILSGSSERTKIVFICSPNNPTGNLMRRDSIIEITSEFRGIVVVDEAYIHFADVPSMNRTLGDLPNLVVLQTFSKAWGMAGVRVGLAFANTEIIDLMNRVKPPYNVSSIAQHAVHDALDDLERIEQWVAETNTERAKLVTRVVGLGFVRMVYPSDANFLLVKVDDADAIYRFLIDEKIVVRDRSNVALCENCLRITVGVKDENNRLVDALTRFARLGRKEATRSIC